VRPRAPFLAGDLEELDALLLSRADEVVAMREIAGGERDPLVIGLRHDIDNTFEPCLRLAAWEHDRHYRATYFVLHDSPYWSWPGLRDALDVIAELGHEIGLHANAIAEAFRQERPPELILESALERLRSWGHRISGVAAHGDELCHEAHFVNDEMFIECVRPEYGDHDRQVSCRGRRLRLDPQPLAVYGLDYDVYRLPRRLYYSDSGGSWSERWPMMVDAFPSAFGQLHVLLHPCWWVDAFVREEAAA
jgi:hypothetical protein